MQALERWPSSSVERDDLAVDDRAVGIDGLESLRDLGETRREVDPVTRNEPDGRAFLVRDDSIPVELARMSPSAAAESSAQAQGLRRRSGRATNSNVLAGPYSSRRRSPVSGPVHSTRAAAKAVAASLAATNSTSHRSS
jgi:hypothetical protein